MKYLLMVYSDEKVWSEAEREECIKQSVQLCHELAGKGQYLSASPLHPVSTATSVRVRNGKTEVIDGPFAETHEQLGGYFLVDVKNIDEALAIAKRIPGSARGTIEVRPLYSAENLP
ncbi:MAG: YciI family protein [Proteobacteria bacterium]|nr:MAG: YciI family protein [Pseudomonadota bacterium]